MVWNISCFPFHIWDNHPNWRSSSFFRGVGQHGSTTNQIWDDPWVNNDDDSNSNSNSNKQKNKNKNKNKNNQQHQHHHHQQQQQEEQTRRQNLDFLKIMFTFPKGNSTTWGIWRDFLVGHLSKSTNGCQSLEHRGDIHGHQKRVASTMSRHVHGMGSKFQRLVAANLDIITIMHKYIYKIF